MSGPFNRKSWCTSIPSLPFLRKIMQFFSWILIINGTGMGSEKTSSGRVLGFISNLITERVWVYVKRHPQTLRPTHRHIIGLAYYMTILWTYITGDITCIYRHKRLLYGSNSFETLKFPWSKYLSAFFILVRVWNWKKKLSITAYHSDRLFWGMKVPIKFFGIWLLLKPYMGWGVVLPPREWAEEQSSAIT